MFKLLKRLWKDELAAVAVSVALSLFGLVAVGGIAFDYARMATLDTELQNAADQAALAGATQLDRSSGARDRARTAAQTLVLNNTRISNDGGGQSIAVPIIEFLTTVNSPATTDADATRIRVRVSPRSVNYALTPIVGLLSSGNLNASALAGVQTSVCNVPPVYVAIDPSKEVLSKIVVKGIGLRLLYNVGTGQFGYLQNGKTGFNSVKQLMAWDYQEGYCQATGTVSLQAGDAQSVAKGFDTRFSSGNTSANCPNGGGTCSPAAITKEYPVDLCHKTTAVLDCTSTIGNGNWGTPGTRYDDYLNEHVSKGKQYNFDLDRRRLTVAVIPYGSLGSGNSGTSVQPERWLDVFVVRRMEGDKKEKDSLYVEVISESAYANNGLRNVPYLIE